MKLKTLVIAVAVLAVASVATWLLKREGNAPATDPRVGQPILDPAVLENVAALRLKSSGKEVNVVNTEPGGSSWIIREYYDLPLDFNKLSTFVSSLTNPDAKIVQFASANPERIARMGFGDAEIELLNAAGEALWTMHIGRTIENGGRFAKFGDEEKAYIADFNAWIDTTEKNWADAALLPVKPEQVTSMQIEFADGTSFSMTRETSSSPWSAAGLAEGETLKESEVTSLLNKLTGLRFTETNAPDAREVLAAREHTRSIKVTVDSGTVYTIDLGREPAPPAPPPPPPPAEGEEAPPPPPEPKPGPVYVFVRSSQSDDPFNARMEKRGYQIAEWTFNGLPQDRSVFIQTPPPPAPVVSDVTPASADDGEQPAAPADGTEPTEPTP